MFGVRSLLIGVAAAACLCGCDRTPSAAGQASNIQAANSTGPLETAAAPQAGRWVVVHSPEAERDTILLDTATGRTWSRVQVGDLTDEPAAWDPMPQLNSAEDFATLRANHPPKPTNARAARAAATTPETATPTGDSN